MAAATGRSSAAIPSSARARKRCRCSTPSSKSIRARNRAISEETPACRLYLTTPPELVSGGVSITAFADLLLKAIATNDVACLRIAGDDAARVTTIAKTLLPLAQDRGVAVLLDDSDLAAKLRADGVHLIDAGLYRDARRMVGNDGIVGVSCPLERHDAMTVGDDGADYVQFTVTPENAEDALDLVTWWTEMMTVPCVVAGSITPAIAEQLIAAGVDFLAPNPGIWSENDPVAAIAALSAH